MRKLLLLSVLIVTIVAPLLAARDRNAARGLRTAVIVFVLFNALYIGAVTRFIRSPF